MSPDPCGPSKDRTYWLETLGCPKNQVDSDKLEGTLLAGGYVPAASPQDADLVVVNTCAFVEAAREESVGSILEMGAAKREGARLVVTGCMAERYGGELAAQLPEVDLVAPFGVPVTIGAKQSRLLPSFDLLNLPRPPAAAPWAYLKVAEGCDRRCGFCAIPSFRGPQRSRSMDAILEEVDALGDGLRGGLKEVVLVAQDLASWGLDRSIGQSRARAREPARGEAEVVSRPIAGLVEVLAKRVPRVRLLYIYPSSLDDRLVEAILRTGVPYFDLSLQHASRPLLARMRRPGDGERFLSRIQSIREAEPDSTIRSSFVIGYPGETEEDHDELLSFLQAAQLDWAGFFPYSEEAGTHAAALDRKVAPGLALERLRECSEAQDAVTASRREALVGETVEVLVDSPGKARSHREAPEIDGVVRVPAGIPAGEILRVLVTGVQFPDLEAAPVLGTSARAEPAA